MAKRELGKNVSDPLDAHTKSFLTFLRNDWKEKKDRCFLYQHFSETRNSDEKIRKSISEFFYNVEKGRSLPLTLPLLIKFCNYCNKSPNHVLKFKNNDISNTLSFNIKRAELEIKNIGKDLLIPIQFDIHSTTILFIRFKNGMLDYVILSIDPSEPFNVVKDLKVNEDFFETIEIIPFIEPTYISAKKRFNEIIAGYQDNLSELNINRINPQKLTMFPSSLFSIEGTTTTIDDKIPIEEQHKKQKDFIQER